MIFSRNSIKNIFAGRKTQTRRLKRKVELAKWEYDTIDLIRSDYTDFDSFTERVKKIENGKFISAIMSKNGREKFRVGKTYSVQPGRGKKSIGRIKIKKIEVRELIDIHDVDVRAEGFSNREEFFKVFCKLNWRLIPKKLKKIDFNDFEELAEKWNPAVWVIEFELVEARK